LKQQPVGLASKPGRYSYSTSVKCKLCPGIGANHPVDMFDESPTFGVCTPCRLGVPPEKKERRKRVAA
jgi:hypothetical protein